MRLRYDFAVKESVTVDQEFAFIFGRRELSYGRYTYRFNQQQIHHERTIQKMLSRYPQITGKCILDDLGVG